MVDEKKFSTCQVSPERIVLNLESEVMRDPGSVPTGGNIFHWIFLFSCSKASAANIGIIVHFEKTLMLSLRAQYEQNLKSLVGVT